MTFARIRKTTCVESIALNTWEHLLSKICWEHCSQQIHLFWESLEELYRVHVTFVWLQRPPSGSCIERNWFIDLYVLRLCNKSTRMRAQHCSYAIRTNSKAVFPLRICSCKTSPTLTLCRPVYEYIVPGFWPKTSRFIKKNIKMSHTSHMKSPYSQMLESQSFLLNNLAPLWQIIKSF